MRSQELIDILKRVQVDVEINLYAYLIPEHILRSALFEPRFEEIAAYCKADTNDINSIISKTIEEQERVKSVADVIPTQEYNQTLKTCAMFSDNHPTNIRVEHLLLALLKNGEDSIAYYALVKNNVTQENVRRFIEDSTKSVNLKYVENIVEKAKQGTFSPLIGREEELNRIIQILHKKRAPNIVLCSNPGVGKTALVEGLAKKISNGDVPETLKNASVWSLDLSSIVAGAKLRGDFEERLKNTLDEVVKTDNSILFIDELHCMVGTGNSEGSMDAGNILKPYLSEGRIRCIGATTYDEYKSKLLKDKAFARRFKKIDLAEPTKEETLQILQGLKITYQDFHGVIFSDEILESIVNLSDRYLKGQFFPNKAIEVLDEIGSKYRSGLITGDRASVKDVEDVISKIANIPYVTADDTEKDTLRHLSDNIKKELFGQDEIVDKVVSHIKLAKAGLTNKNKPLGVFGAVGTTGSGKTEFAKQLAKNLGISFLKLDMSEYSEKNSVSKLIGTSPGYVGFEQSGVLTEYLLQHPNCVVLFDEIEKADPAIYDLLLQVMDEGKLTDNNNREASFRNSIIIMTSNVGATLAEQSKMTIGFSGESQKDRIFDSELKKSFSPEFRNRFTEIFRFNEIDEKVMGLIADKEIQHLNDALKGKNILIKLMASAREFLVRNAKNEKMGGRPIERLVHKHIAEKLVDKILFDDLKNIVVTFEERNNELINTPVV